MQITGSQIIPAPAPLVWNALNDPEVLRHCLPGCESVVRNEPDAFSIVMTASVGPLKARFNGLLRITEAQPPSGCVMVFEGQGGAMGFGKGTSTVVLREAADGTELTYTANAQIGGKLAQVGTRLIDSVARKMSDDFFSAFRQRVSEPQVAAPVAVTVVAPDAGAAAAKPVEVPPARSDDSPRPDGLVPAWWILLAALGGALGGFLACRLF